MSQVIGKIYTKSTANNLYGSVLNSVEINSSLLQKLTSQTPNYIMFQIIQGKLVVLDSKRNVIYTNGNFNAVSASTVFRIFSTSIVNELLKEGNNSETYIEIRNNVLTITNGDETLEESELCPPFYP
jgi:16S rRNA A1518/A1519 N6-dimethyltransferase RsmA/KsgA/DIM1 with predicted DNA glycosylase/AP lyase activity